MQWRDFWWQTGHVLLAKVQSSQRFVMGLPPTNYRLSRCYNYVFRTHPTQHRYFFEVHLWQPLKPLPAPAFACMKGRL